MEKSAILHGTTPSAKTPFFTLVTTRPNKAQLIPQSGNILLIIFVQHTLLSSFNLNQSHLDSSSWGGGTDSQYGQMSVNISRAKMAKFDNFMGFDEIWHFLRKKYIKTPKNCLVTVMGQCRWLNNRKILKILVRFGGICRVKRCERRFIRAETTIKFCNAFMYIHCTYVFSNNSFLSE